MVKIKSYFIDAPICILKCKEIDSDVFWLLGCEMFTTLDLRKIYFRHGKIMFKWFLNLKYCFDVFAILVINGVKLLLFKLRCLTLLIYAFYWFIGDSYCVYFI